MTQVAPPSGVAMISPAVLVAKQALTLGQSTPNSCCVVGDVPVAQFFPSFVQAMVPP
jgi:hypothetical protein